MAVISYDSVRNLILESFEASCHADRGWYGVCINHENGEIEQRVEPSADFFLVGGTMLWCNNLNNHPRFQCDEDREAAIDAARQDPEGFIEIQCPDLEALIKQAGHTLAY